MYAPPNFCGCMPHRTLGFFLWFFLNTSQFFVNSDGKKFHPENHNIFQTTTSFYSKKDLKIIKHRFFLVKKKLEIQVIVCMIMLTRSSEKILRFIIIAPIFLMSLLVETESLPFVTMDGDGLE